MEDIKNIKGFKKPYIKLLFISSTEKWSHPIKKVKYFFQDIKYAIHRMRYGWNPYDCWNFDQWFLYVIPQMLKEYIDNTHSYSDYYFNEKGEKCSCTFEEWEALVNKIIQYLINAREESYINEYLEEYLSSGIKNDEIQKKYFEREKEIYTERLINKTKAISLINYNFFNLWD